MHLRDKINNLKKEELTEIYNIWWGSGNCYGEDDLKSHIARYILIFYQMRSFKQSCREKCKFLIEELNYRANQKD